MSLSGWMKRFVLANYRSNDLVGTHQFELDSNRHILLALGNFKVGELKGIDRLANPLQ